MITKTSVVNIGISFGVLVGTNHGDWIMDDTEEHALKNALEACFKYWSLYTERKRKEGNHSNAMVWAQNNENGHMFCFTRGEYANGLKEYVNDLDRHAFLLGGTNHGETDGR